MSRVKKAPPQQPFFLLSIDPAKAAGWAFFVEGKPKMWGAVDGSMWKTLNTALQAVKATLDREHLKSSECVIEDGFFQYGKQTFRGTLTLGRRRGLAQAAGESVGITKFTFIGPSTWQNALGWKRGQDTKEWSLAYVKQRFGIEGITADESDALALGAYYLSTFG